MTKNLPEFQNAVAVSGEISELKCEKLSGKYFLTGNQKEPCGVAFQNLSDIVLIKMVLFNFFEVKVTFYELDIIKVKHVLC